ncbi:MAG: hypothetical protein JWO38_975 [Gemmataceae bacterium]|nr:hypothetical protein [Gemmataceae bacterium]
MATATTTTVGVFSTRAAAEQAVRDLRAAGFRDDEIGLVGRTESGRVERTTGAGDTMAEEGAAAGAIAGAGVGAAIGFGVLAGAIPAIGPAIVAGTLGTILTNAVAGATVAGLVGALIGFGIPEDDARYYEGEVKAGRYLVTVTANGRGAEARAILHRNGGFDRTSPARGV